VSDEHRRVALVTGGGRGAGAEVVRGLAARGYSVAIHCHASLREARALACEVEASGKQAFAVTANFREEGAVRAMMHRVLDHFGRLDVVAACARLRRPVALDELTTRDLMAHYEVNILGTFIVAQEALPVMLAQPEGGVLIACAALDEPQPGDLPFAASQAAIPAFIKALTAEWASRYPRLRADCVTTTDTQTSEDVASVILSRIDDFM
jgi:NAD(P)-dependent dehydrogenase (short-subunit alcohol dehydrogenase family)